MNLTPTKATLKRDAFIPRSDSLQGPFAVNTWVESVAGDISHILW